jgi:two-component system sensor histidine kinase UhpB
LELANLQQQAFAASETIRTLSHELHPQLLQHFGLVPALRNGCAEFARLKKIDVAFHADEGLKEIQADIGLCLYRVVQEALHNTARHANARRVEITLTSGDEGALDLRIADDGRGFDATDTRRRPGLGLISIDERVRLVGGEVQLWSQPGRGTEIRVHVPMLAREETVKGDDEPSEGAVGGRQHGRGAESGSLAAS